MLAKRVLALVRLFYPSGFDRQRQPSYSGKWTIPASKKIE
jgi:hypothetical protein